MAEQVIDQNVYDDLADTVGEDFLVEMLEAFFEEGKQFLDELRVALKDGDVDRFRRAAHSLKSNAATFGALPLSEQAKELEEMARENQLGGAAGKVEAISASFSIAKAALEELQNG